MLVPIIFCVCLCSRVLFVKSELADSGNLIIRIKPGTNCSIEKQAYTFTEGNKVQLVLKKKYSINAGWVRNLNSLKPQEPFLSDLTNTRNLTVDKSSEGIWQFKFLYLREHDKMEESSREEYNKINHTRLICSTRVTIVPAPMNQTTKYWIIGSVVGVIILVIMFAQTSYIVKLRAKAKSSNRLEYLSKKSESTGNDRARYSTNPGQKMKIVAPVDDNSRDSVIYEAPNIELPINDRVPILPPEPPAINTIPCTPRLDHNIRIERQAMLAAAMNCPTQHSTFPRHKLLEINVANRPPIAIPTHNDGEIYEELDPIEENTYEPPPIIKTMPHKPPASQKKIALAKLPDAQSDSLKLRITGKKPVATPKPQSFQIPQDIPPVNELEMAFKKRNNVVQVPIHTIPSPSTSGGFSPKLKPPPVVNTRPRGPPVPMPVPQPIQEELYYNEPRDSSDEEWTYEPLKALKNYDQNIYSE